MWIRIDTDIADNEKIQRAARSILGLSTGQMVGHFVMMLCKLAHYCPNGAIAQVHPATLEEYARWQGEPGVFDRAIREHFVTDGVLDGWEERQGKLMARQERDRNRKKAARDAAKASRPQDGPQDTARTLRSPSGGAATVNGNGYGNEHSKAAAAGAISIDYVTRCVVALNRAQQANAKIGHRATEIPATSQSGVVDWEQDEIPVEVAEAVIRERASTFTPRSNRRQIKSLRYFDEAVRERWASIQESGVTLAADVPGARDLNDAAFFRKRGL